MWETLGCTRDPLLLSWRQTTYRKLSSSPSLGLSASETKRRLKKDLGEFFFFFLPGQHVVLLNGLASRDIISSFNCPSCQQLLHVCLPRVNDGRWALSE